MKTYQVSIVASNIEAETEEGAITAFEELIKEGAFGRDSYEVEEEEVTDNDLQDLAQNSDK